MEHFRWLIEQPDSPAKARLLLAHGAGAPMDSPFLVEYAQALASLGVEVVRFEFAYMAARRSGGKRRPPERTEQLLAQWHEVYQHFNLVDLPTFIGGKSMGGRMASLYSSEYAVDPSGVICLGFPFHPVGKPDKLRVEHLPTLPTPCLVIQGERDRFGARSEVASYPLERNVQVQWLERCDHEFKPLKSTGETQQSMIQLAAKISANFISECLRERGQSVS